MTVTGIFIWLGGGQNTELTDHSDRANYAVTGATVLLFATVSGVLTAAALAATDNWPLLAALAVALIVAALAGAVGRAVATARPGAGPDRIGLLARIGVAVLLGGLIAELAATVLFGSTVHRLLDEQAQRASASAPAVVAAGSELDRARADRTALDQSIAKAQADVDRYLVIARCEFNAAPECSPLTSTGVYGNGPEAGVANEMLDDARRQLAAERARIDPLDRRIADDEKALAAAQSSAVTGAERGLSARWQAMNDYTTHAAGALPLRILTIVGVILLALLPLILRWWRGETFLDRRLAARVVQDRAEQQANAAIAIKRAEVRAEAETLRAEQQLTAARLEVEADTAIDRERQRTRIIAAIGGIEFGITEPPRRGELPAGSAGDRKDSSVSHQTPNLPATVTAGALQPLASIPAQPPATQRSGGLELPIIGTVPFTDTAARFIRPLVPSFVANAFDSATHPLRTARQAFEEVEEVTFTLRRTRKVTIDTQDSHAPAGYQLAPGSPEAAHAQRVAATVVDADYSAINDPRYLPPAAHREGHSLPGGDRDDELTGRHDPELPGRSTRELPPGR